MRFPALLTRALPASADHSGSIWHGRALARAALGAAPFVAAALLTAAPDLLLAQSPGRTSIKFSLDVRAEGPEPLFFLPQDRGYFKAEGLDVIGDDVVAPLDPLTRVVSGGYDMGFADINALIRYRDQHPTAPIRAVFMVYNKPPYAVVTRKSRGISEPRQLENKRLGASANGAALAQWPLFAKLNQIDISKVSIETIGIPVRAPMLAAGQIDAALGASFQLYVDLKDRGVPVEDIVLMLMENYGLILYGSSIVVNSKFAAEKPEAVRAFLRAFLRGLQDTIRRPAEAVETILKRNDLAKKEVELERLRIAIRDNIVTPEVKANGLGGVDPVRFAQSIDQIGLTFHFKAKPKPDDVFDSAFLPPLNERKLDR